MAVARTAQMSQHGPADEKDEHRQAAQQLGRAKAHLVRWLAMCVVSARSEEKIRTLSSLSDLS